LNPDSVKKTNRILKKINGAAAKKVITINAVNKDSMAAEQAVLAAIREKDSLKQDAINKSEMLYQRIKANPEKYLNLSTG